MIKYVEIKRKDVLGYSRIVENCGGSLSIIGKTETGKIACKIDVPNDKWSFLSIRMRGVQLMLDFNYESIERKNGSHK